MRYGEISIDTTALKRDAQTLRGSLRQAEGELEGMFQSVQALHRCWEGPAQEAYRNSFLKDYQQAKDFCEKLRDMIACMEHSAQEYERASAQVEDVLSALRV